MIKRLLFETWINDRGNWRRYGFRLRSYCSVLKAAQRRLNEGYDVEIRKYFYLED